MVSQGKKLIAEIPNSAIEQQLERILVSPDFAASQQLSKFLRFVVAETLAGRANRIKQSTVAVKVFERTVNFDAQADPIVRVQAARLRRTLERYYLTRGSQDPILITIPKGTYVPVFQELEISKEQAPLPVAIRPVKLNSSIPRIAVMPFQNCTGDPDRDFFADGLSEELSTALTNFERVSVIAHYSTRRYLDQSWDLSEIGKELGVQYIINGNIRQCNSRIRLYVQLNSTVTREQLWAQRFERVLTTENLFEIQDEIVSSVAGLLMSHFGILPMKLVQSCHHKPIVQLSAYEAVLRYHHYELTLSQTAFVEAFAALKHGLTLEPNYGIAWAMMGLLHFDIYAFGFEVSDSSLAQGLDCVQKALLLDSRCQYAYYVRAVGYLMQQNTQGVIESAERMILLNPRDSYMLGLAGWLISLAGEFQRGLLLLEQSKQLNPYYPRWFHFAHYLYYYQQGDYESALVEAEKFALSDLFWTYLMQAAALVQLGRQTEAQEAYARLVQLQPDFSRRPRYYLDCFIICDELVQKFLQVFDCLSTVISYQLPVTNKLLSN